MQQGKHRIKRRLLLDEKETGGGGKSRRNRREEEIGMESTERNGSNFGELNRLYLV